MGSSFASGFKTGFGSAFLQFALERFASFGSFAWKEISVIWGVEDELRKLQRTSLKIQDLVHHVDGSPLRFFGRNTAWQIWFEDMRKLAYDADALLDRVSLHLSIYCSEHSVSSNQQKQVFSMVVSSPSELNVPSEISSMRSKLDELAKEMESLVMIEKIKFGAITASTISSQCSNFYPKTSSFIHCESMVGRLQDKECILNLLSEQCDFSVIPIVGMGGIGKTALARLVYNDLTVCKFDIKMWVSISMEFDVIRITKSIIEHATLCACDLSDLNSLQVKLQQVLGTQKLLLVLDDYWSEKYDDWDILSSLFRFVAKGSKVIVTTRSTKVSTIVSSSEGNKLEILSDNDCWELIKQKTLLSTVPSHNLELIGRQIAEKCKGLPLVAVTVGNMLHCKSTEEEWHSILENEIWDMPQGENIFHDLMKSYLYLPADLQKCFAYCSIFPKNHEFDIEELILLWMAEGFIQPIGDRRLEDLGRDYFNDLYSRSFFQQCASISNLTVYKMHDLVHDMARLVSKDICLHVKYNLPNCYPLFGNTCHLSLSHDSSQALELKASQMNERLRTFLVMSNTASSGEVHPQLFSHLLFLRVLGLSDVGLTELTNDVDQLKYLRYLNLSENPISFLPESMCKLVALQVLKLRNCFQLRDLPQNMSNLLNLRHLDFNIKGRLTSLPPQFGRLTNLQTLLVYIVGSKKGNGIEELKDLNCLRGSLCIQNIDNVLDAGKAGDAKLSQKIGLNKLELQWRRLSDNLAPQLRDAQAVVLAKLQPPENLKELVIENYCGKIYPNWLSDPVPNFTSVHLKGLKYCEYLPSLGDLPFLKSFVIQDMPCLKNVNPQFYGGNAVKFPSLESFELRGMSKLIDWINGSNGAMPRLNTFVIHDCPMLTSLPQEFQSLLPNSNISDCPSLQFP